MPTAVTKGITVISSAMYAPSYSEGVKFAFAHSIRIKNNSQQTVKIIGKRIHIIHNPRKIDVDEYNNVQGLQPVLDPGQSFSYTTCRIIYAPRGWVYGSYMIMPTDGGFFEAALDMTKLERIA